MANYANQKVFLIQELGELQHTIQEQDKNKSFLVALNWDKLLNVMIDLDPPEFVLWLYILKWRGKDRGYNFSPADLEEHFGWSENSSRKYRQGLEKKKYLVPISKTFYNFIPYPETTQERADIKIGHNHKKRMDHDPA